MGKYSGPGKSYRQGLSLIEAVEMFGDPDFTEQWFVDQRWPDGVEVPWRLRRASTFSTAEPARNQPFRCNDCRRDFSVKTDTIMHGSKLSLKMWRIAMYVLTTGIKGDVQHEAPYGT